MEPKVYLITGSSRGIGRAAAEKLLKDGSKVMVNSRSVPNEIDWMDRYSSEQIGYVCGDIGSEQDCQDIVSATVDKFGSLDGLVNNASVTQFIDQKNFSGITSDIWNEILSVNLVGTWNMSKYSHPHLLASRGAIVNVASIAGVTATGSCIPYSVSKAGVIHLTKLLAKTLGPEIRVNAVAPGLVKTDWHAESTMDWEGYSESVPLGRYAGASDIANTICMLLADSYVTGELIRLDGGRSLG